MARGKKYWLMKSEPDVFSIEDLERAGTEPWDGIRNYQARNFMRDDMKKGDEVLFYHSRAKPPGVAGLARVCREAYPDHTARDPKSKYHDPRATKENPIWMQSSTLNGSTITTDHRATHPTAGQSTTVPPCTG